MTCPESQLHGVGEMFDPIEYNTSVIHGCYILRNVHINSCRILKVRVLPYFTSNSLCITIPCVVPNVVFHYNTLYSSRTPRSKVNWPLPHTITLFATFFTPL